MGAFPDVHAAALGYAQHILALWTQSRQQPRRLDLASRHENVWGACTSRASEPGKVGYDRRCNCAPNASLPISPLLDRDLIPLTPVATACL